MSVSVELPAMGEGVTEGTIIRWLKSEGERVEADEPLVEISTDKVDAELPSPAAGVLTKIIVAADQTVSVGTAIAVIEESGNGTKPAGRAVPPEEPERHQPPESSPDAPPAEPQPDREPQSTPVKPDAPAEPESERSPDSLIPLSPLLRKLARERKVDLSLVRGSGEGGRITKRDVVDFAERSAGEAAPAQTTPAAAKETAQGEPRPATPGTVEFTRIRKLIAEHMTRSQRTAAHVTDVVEVDMTRVARLRDRAKRSFEETEGFSLTFLPFVAQATVEALRAFPDLNAHIAEDGTSATVHGQVNLGIAVGRDEGLIVPVVKRADGLNLVGLARGINDVAGRARTKGGLKPDDVTGGTFTISNGGSFGSVIFTPIINQPQAAVLGVGAVAKRPAVISVDGADAIAVRHLMYLCLSYDHRWIDGHRATSFNNRIRQLLEAADYGPEFGLEPE